MKNTTRTTGTKKTKRKGKKKKRSSFRRVAAISAIMLALSTRVFGMPTVEEQIPSKRAEMSVHETSPQTPGAMDKTRVRTTSGEELSDKSENNLLTIDIFASSLPYVAGMHIVRVYTEIPPKERGEFDDKFYKMVLELEKRGDYELAGMLCINHITENGMQMSYNLNLFLLETAKKQFQLASKQLENLDKEASEYYKHMADELKKIIDQLEGE